MIKYIKKLIKKQKLLKKYKKGNKQWDDFIWFMNRYKYDINLTYYMEQDFHCELRCYNRLKKL